MSLSCLSCNGKPEAVDAGFQRNHGSAWSQLLCCRPSTSETSWPGNRTPPPAYVQLRSTSSSCSCSYSNQQQPQPQPQPAHRKISSTRRPLLGGGGDGRQSGPPRLARSAGIRRDWSFKDLGGKEILSNIMQQEGLHCRYKTRKMIDVIN